MTDVSLMRCIHSDDLGMCEKRMNQKDIESDRCAVPASKLTMDLPKTYPADGRACAVVCDDVCHRRSNYTVRVNRPLKLRSGALWREMELCLVRRLRSLFSGH
jgi:hypothetical protein